MTDAINFHIPEVLVRQIAGRAVYIWGARHEGYAAKLALGRHGVVADGYIDSSLALVGASAFGLSIVSPATFFTQKKPHNTFIVIASGFFADEITEQCIAEGWEEKHDFTVYGDLRRFNYQVDVAGMCNLRCISCPRGNWPRHRTPGCMSAHVYEKLVDKILKDDPWTGIITLYNWGEPLLNPELPEIISFTRKKGLLSAVSSNLAMKTDFRPVVQAGPDWFRVSNSGWGVNYETTHTGGKWDVFYANCLKLAKYRDQYHREMIVEFFFHIYAHNRDDFHRIQSFCKEMNFVLRYRHAALAPLDNIALVVAQHPLSKSAARTRELQFFGVDEVMDIARSEMHRPCFYMDHLWIDWDLSIAHCMEWYDPSLKLLDKNFMETSLDEIDATRRNSEHCRECMKQGIHRAYSVYGDEKLIAAKSSIPVQKEE